MTGLLHQPLPGITLLCKVVDNYGDIGFVYRLARALSSLPDCPPLRLVVDNLDSFLQIAPGIRSSVPVQMYNGWTVYDWHADAVCMQAFTAEPPETVLECFQCGRPDWLEHLLFDTGVADIVHIINIDYLTAEPYADDFHCLQSLTRSVRVQKVNFMPGFTEKTGGLVLDAPFMQSLSDRTAALSAVKPYVPELCTGSARAALFPVTVFSYERDFAPVVQALTDFARTVPEPLHVFLAAGRGAPPFLDAWNRAGQPFAVTQLPFMPQTVWDALLCISSFSFVRGEDSLSRACLAGVPFIWHAYPQDDEYQQVKVQALLDRMRPFFEPAVFELLEKYWLLYNTSAGSPDEQQMLLAGLLLKYRVLCSGFDSFARNLRTNGDCAAHLLAYIAENCR